MTSIVGAFLVGLVLTTAVAWAQVDFAVVDLGTLPGDVESSASAINRRGQVVGFSTPGPFIGGERHAFLWTAASGMLPLASLPGSNVSHAVDINDRGQIVGYSQDASGNDVAVLWTENGDIQSLGTLGGDWSLGAGINERGEVAGVSVLIGSSLPQHAFLWTAEDGMQDLGTLGSDHSTANRINNLGQIAGASATSLGERRPFLWSRALGMVDLGSLGGNSSTASGVNDVGYVSGDSRISSSSLSSHPFLWTVRDGMQDLGTLVGGFGRATGINQRGHVAGDSLTAAGESRALVWTAESGMLELSTLGGDRAAAIDINDHGQVVGLSRTASGTFHATLWILDLPSPDIGELIELLIQGVQNLLDIGILTVDQADGLFDKLEAAKNKLGQPNPGSNHALAQQLQAFVNQLNGWVPSVLDAVEVATLIDLADEAIEQAESPPP